LPYSVGGVSLTLLVEVSRLSSPLTGRVEILNYKREWRCHGSDGWWWTVAASGT